MPHHRVFRILPAGLVALGGLTAGCFEESGGAAGISSKTLIAVAPSDFLGKVPCLNAEGAMRVYVATAFDITEGALEGSSEPIVLPSAAPTICHQTTAFGLVAPLHDYVVRIEGYDTNDIHPLDRGSPVMLDPQGRFVSPRWTSLCTGSRSTSAEGGADSGAAAGEDSGVAGGEDSGGAAAEDSGSPVDSPPASCEVDPLSARGRGVTAFRTVTRHASVCTPLCDRGSPRATGMIVRISEALGGLSCGDLPGQVSSFDVTPENQGLSAQNDVACSGEARFDHGIVAGTSYGFVVTGFEAGNGAPRWGTHCAGVALPGVVAVASCSPLSTTGILEIDVAGLLSQAGLECSGVARISAALSGASAPRQETSGPPNCAPIRFSNLASGLKIADVSIEPATGGSPRAARCEAVVVPGNSIAARCLLLSGTP
jgi:hypothetical protein